LVVQAHEVILNNLVVSYKDSTSTRGQQ